MERKVNDAKKKIVQDMEKVNFKLHHLNTNPDPIGTRDLYFVNRTFNIVLQNMKEVGFCITFNKEAIKMIF